MFCRFKNLQTTSNPTYCTPGQSLRNVGRLWNAGFGKRQKILDTDPPVQSDCPKGAFRCSPTFKTAVPLKRAVALTVNRLAGSLSLWREVPGAKSLVLLPGPGQPHRGNAGFFRRSSGHHPSARLGAQNPTPLPQTEALSLSKGYTKTLCIPPNLTSTEFMRERPGRR